VRALVASEPEKAYRRHTVAEEKMAILELLCILAFAFN